MESERELKFLSVDDVVAFHARAIRDYGGADGIGDPEGLDGAVMAVPQFVHYQSESDIFDVAAAYAFYIAEKHAFLDGNKRTAWATAHAFLEVNGLNPCYTPDSAETWMIAIAEHRLDRRGFAQILREEYEKWSSRESDM